MESDHGLGEREQARWKKKRENRDEGTKGDVPAKGQRIAREAGLMTDGHKPMAANMHMWMQRWITIESHAEKEQIKLSNRTGATEMKKERERV